MDATTRKLLQLLDAESPAEMRAAAALVLGAVAEKDGGIAKTLVGAIEDPEQPVRMQVLATLGNLKIEAALPRLLEKISEGGPEAEVAAQAAGKLGARGTRALRELMHKVAPGLRRRIAAALAAGGTASAETAALDTLLDTDPGVVDAATRTLTDKIPNLSKDHQRALVEHVLELLKVGKGDKLPLVSEAALLRVLAALRDPRGEAAFWLRIDPPHPAALRGTALQALGTLPPPTSPDKLKRLLVCAADADFCVAAPALMILKAVPINDRLLKNWLKLFDAPDPAARRFVIEKLGERDKAEVAAGLIKQLRHGDRGLRDEAVSRLSKLEHGRHALAHALLDAETPDETWTLARAQMPFVRDYSAALRGKVFNQLCKYLEAGDRRADALQALLREAEARGLRDKLEDRALALRKKKNYAQALIYLRLLTRDPACGEAIRFEQAGCALRVSSHDLAADSRAADPALHSFAGLLHRHETDPLQLVAKAKWLTPEDLFYLGFHFAEGIGQLKDFGAAVLRLLIKRSSKSKLAKDARSKLRSHGLT